MNLDEIEEKVSKCCVLTWKEWVVLFLHFRTHVAWGLIIATVSLSVAEILTKPLVLRIAILIGLLASAMSLVDTVAHLYYH